MSVPLNIDIAIETANSAKTVRELNQSLKSLIGLQGQISSSSSAEFKKLRDAITQTENKVGDLKDGFQTLKGSGVERLSGSLNLLKQGFQNADPEQLTIAMKGLKGAMSAIPIFLVVEGLKLLYDNFDKVKEVLFGTTSEVERQAYELKALQAQTEANRKATDDYIKSLDTQIDTLRLQKGSTSEIVALIKERTKTEVNAINAEIAKKDELIKKTNDEIAANKITLEQSQLRAAGSVTNYELIVNNEQKGLTTKLDSLIKEKTALEQQRIQKENIAAKGAKEVNDINEEAYNKLKQKYADDAAEFNRLMGLKQEASEALAAQRIADEQAVNQKLIDTYLENKNAEQYIKEQFAKQDEEADKDLSNRRQNRQRNELAFQASFEQKSLAQKIDAIEIDRDTQLTNENLTQQQRISIIQKSENDILQLKIKKGEEYVSYAKATVNVLSELNTLQTQNESQQLLQQKYNKDAAIQDDTNRTQEKLDAEQEATSKLLDNDQLTAQQRDAITKNSENKQKQITAQSKNAQLNISNQYAKAEIEIRKKQFERQKAIQITTGIINTAASVLQTLASTPYPANIPLAVAVGAAGAIQVGIIASQEFDDGGAAANSNVAPISSSIGVGGSSSSSGGAPQGYNPQAAGKDFSTFNSNSEIEKARQQRVYVLESDIREVGQRIDVYENRATFGNK